jgi:hypothetical protein
MLSDITGCIHNVVIYHQQATSLTRVSYQLLCRPFRHFLPISTLNALSVILAPGRCWERLVMMGLNPRLGCSNVLFPCLSKTGGKSKPMEENDDPLGRVPVSWVWTRAKVMRKGVLLNVISYSNPRMNGHTCYKWLEPGTLRYPNNHVQSYGFLPHKSA